MPSLDPPIEIKPYRYGKSVAARLWMESLLDEGRSVLVVSNQGTAIHKKDMKTGFVVITPIDVTKKGWMSIC